MYKTAKALHFVGLAMFLGSILRLYPWGGDRVPTAPFDCKKLIIAGVRWPTTSPCAGWGAPA